MKKSKTNPRRNHFIWAACAVLEIVFGGSCYKPSPDPTVSATIAPVYQPTYLSNQIFLGLEDSTSPRILNFMDFESSVNLDPTVSKAAEQAQLSGAWVPEAYSNGFPFLPKFSMIPGNSDSTMTMILSDSTRLSVQVNAGYFQFARQPTGYITEWTLPVPAITNIYFSGYGLAKDSVLVLMLNVYSADSDANIHNSVFFRCYRP